MTRRMFDNLTRRIARRARRWRTRDGWCDVNRQGFQWRLHPGRHMDDALLEEGVFEANTTRRVRELVQPGMRIIDVGANFGYFTVLFAELVGPHGHVWAFEPTRYYGERLRFHLERNGLSDRVTIAPLGLSDRNESAPVRIGECSATLHPTDNYPIGREEVIELRRLDDVRQSLNIDRVDLVKIDIDGHEPAFLNGARKLLAADRPVMVIEFNQGNLDQAGNDVRKQKRMLEDLGYELRSDRTGRAFESRFEFLYECGNFTHSANAWAYPVMPGLDRPKADETIDPRDAGPIAA